MIIAVLDTGIDPGHPEFQGRIVKGYDFVQDDAKPRDTNGHGTHVAGIAAAAGNNGAGVAGMSWGSKIMPVRVLNGKGQGYASDIADGIQWAVKHDAKVINLSLGGPKGSKALKRAVKSATSAGRIVVAAMGNAGDSVPMYPAAYASALAVAATNSGNQRASYSNYGAHCDVAAPGGEMSYLHDPGGIASTLPGYPVTLTTRDGYSQNYDHLQGTSQAAPLVAGLAALIWSRNRTLTRGQVESIITSTAADLGAPGIDPLFGWGLIDAKAALLAVPAP